MTVEYLNREIFSNFTVHKNKFNDFYFVFNLISLLNKRSMYMHLIKYLSIVLTLVILWQLNVYSQDQDTTSTEGIAWEKVDGMEIEPLGKFIKLFPEGTHINDAKVLLLMQNRMELYRQRKKKPKYVITFKQMGERWLDSKRVEKEKDVKDIIGFSFVKDAYNTPTGHPHISFGFFQPLGKGSGTITMAKHGVPALPTKDGSILAIKTYGMNTKDALKELGAIDTFFGGYHFITPESKSKWTALEGTAYFGLIKGIGFVHIYGDVTVISPKGKGTIIKEK